MHRPRHLARPDDRRLGGWLMTIGVLLLACAIGASLAGPVLTP